MTIQINISGTTIYNVSNDVIIDSIELGKRADYSFEVGSFKMFTSQITKNIPPYSFCRITDDYVSTDYLISSEATAYFTNGKLMHDCKLLSLEAIMECYILGAKTFSLADSPTDKQVLVKTLALINQQYGIGKFRITNTIDTFLQHYSNEYTFPDGTSLYEVVKSIANKNNLRFELNLNSFGYGENSYFYIHFQENATNQYTITDSKLVSFKLMQDGNNYCKYLQCASADVVDRANPTTFKNLTVRATNGIVVDDDNNQLILPIKVEVIIKFTINGYIGIGGFKLKTPYWDRAYVERYYATDDSTWIYSVAKTLFEWRTDSYGQSYWQHLYDLWLKDLGLDNAYFAVKYCKGTASPYYGETWGYICDDEGNEYDIDQKYHYITKWDMTQYLVTKEEFDALDVSQQPNYLFYEPGGKVIQNFKADYRNNLWDNVMGVTNYGMFDNRTSYSFVGVDDDYSCRYSYSIGSGDAPTRPINYRFDVECVPITNPLLVDTKNTTPINETSFKAMTRTYQMGDSNGLLTDFKALSNDIDKQNDTLGDVEAILELDADVYYDDEGNDELYYPEPNHQITFDYKNTSFTFYISSMATRYTNNRKTYQLNLSRTPYKIADAIGVDYQFNPTWLPLDNIIERSLFYKINYDNFRSAYIDKANFFLKIQINSVGTFYLRPVIMKNNGYYVAYCEALDNIVIGMSTDVVDSTKKSINNVKYVDDNGAFHEMSMWFVADDNTLTLAESFKLPLIENHNFSNSIIIANSKMVYKDSREKLTFTIKVNDSFI